MTSIVAVSVSALCVVGTGAVVLGLRPGSGAGQGKARGGAVRNRSGHSQLGYVACFAIALAWPLLAPGSATAQGTCRDTVFFLPCDYWAGRSVDTSAVPPPALAPMSGMSGIWDGAQAETIAVDTPGVFVPDAPGVRHALALDSKSRVYTIYHRGSTMRLYFSYKDPAQPWSPEIALPSSSAYSLHAGVAIGPGADVAQFFFLEGGSNGTSYLVHATYDFVAGQWAPDTIVQSTRTDWPSWTQVDIGADPLGGFHVVWAEPGWNEDIHAWVDQVKYAENTSGAWRNQAVGNVGYAPLIELDRSGRAVIGYHVRRDGHDYKIFAANRFRGDTVWTADSIDTAPAAYEIHDMRLGRDGTLHVLFGGTDCYYCMFIHRLFYTKRPPGSKVFDPWYQIFDHSGRGILMEDCAGHAHAWYPWYDEEQFSSRMYYATNARGTWVTGTFSFGSVPNYQVFEPAMTLDRFDQARAVLSQWVSYQKYRLVYSGSPTVYLDVLDVIRAIDHVYGGDGLCDPYAYDGDCSRAVDAADVVWIINYCFRNGPNGCRF